MSDQNNNINKPSPKPRMRGGGPRGMSMPVEKAKDFKKTLKRLVQYLSVDMVKLIIVFVFSIASMVFTIISPKILGKVTTEIYKGFFIGTMDFSAINDLVVRLIILYVLSAFFGYIQQYLMVGVTQNTVFRMRKDIKDKLTRLPLKYYDGHSHGDLISRVTNDVDTIGSTLQQSVSNIITSVVVIIGVLIMMLTISWQMTLVALVTLPLSFFLIKPIVKRSQKYFKRQQNTLGEINGHVEESFTGHKIIKAYGKEEEFTEKFGEINNKLYDAGWKAQFISGIIMPTINLINNIIYVAISVSGAVLFIKQKIELGDIQSFIQYVRLFSQPISNVANVSNLIQSTVAAAERVFELLDEEEELKNVETPVNVDNLEGNVEIKNIAFSYSDDQELIRNFSIKVDKGETIAIVGPTGAGKTTIVNLLLRFYDVKSGDIQVDGISIYDMRREDLRELFGMVLQDTWLFKGSIKDNIKYGNLDATDEEVCQAAKIANVDHFIRTLTDGYDTVINEEANNISQGQKQLITIARAILANPKILILDEATSSVDTRTETYIQNAMLSLMKGRTNFVIAHRLSTIKNAHKIIVMNNGQIVEIGNHHELLDKKGFYADLYNSQFSNPLE